MSAANRRRLLIISNPAARNGKGHRLNRLLDALREQGTTVDHQPTSGPGDARRIAAEAPLDAVDAVISAGGDGTLNEVVNGLVERDDTPPPVGLLPLGTANVVARECGLPLDDPAALARIIATAPATPVYVGSANGHAFLQMAGVGFDARVVENVNLGLKRRVGPLAYVVQSLAEAFRHRPTTYRVDVDGQTFEAASVVVANGRHYGGPYVCAREARLTKPTLFACLLAGNRRWDVIRYGWGLLSGRLPKFHDVKIVEGRQFTVESRQAEESHGPVQADGEILARLPLRVSLLDRTLPVLAAPA